MGVDLIEQTFWKLLESDDPRLSALIQAWDFSYGHPRYAEFRDGKEIRQQLQEFDIDATLEITLSHDEIVSLAREAAARADVRAAATALIRACGPEPLSTCWKWQTPLRSISCIRQLPPHDLRGANGCGLCGIALAESWDPMNAAQQVLGGFTGECSDVLNQLMVVRWFNHIKLPNPSEKHVAAFRAAIDTIADSDPDDTGKKVAAKLKKHFKGDVYSWCYFMETLGYSGVLKTDRQPGNLQQWTDACNRIGRGEVPSPLCHWRRKMGFDPDVFAELFPRIKFPVTLRPAS